jgi:hypothetical protein
VLTLKQILDTLVEHNRISDGRRAQILTWLAS